MDDTTEGKTLFFIKWTWTWPRAMWAGPELGRSGLEFLLATRSTLPLSGSLRLPRARAPRHAPLLPLYTDGLWGPFQIQHPMVLILFLASTA